MDRVLITMPKNPREFFIAMAIVQAYVFEYLNEVHHAMRDQNFQFTFRMDEKYEKYESSLKVAVNNCPVYDYTGWTGLARSEFTCFIDFDFDVAKRIALRSGKHIIDALGAMIGCTPRRQPILPPPTCTEGKGVLVVTWDGLIEYELKSIKDTSFVSPDSDVLEAEIETAEAVIGHASAFTYLAASYGRKLIEIFPDEETYRLYNNEGYNQYQAIIGNPSMDVIKDVWNNLDLDVNYVP